MSKLRFLALDEVLAIHAMQIDSYGGARGVRDIGALQSAIAMPSATFDGADLHGTLEEKAAAYLFHVCRNHPFVDGNKRVALATALVFLWLNGFELGAGDDDVVDLVVGVAASRITKAEVAVFLKKHARPRRA